MKKHDFFKPIKWSDVEHCRIKMPSVEQKDPKSGMFDEIEPDSADEDFDHEYEELCANNGYNDKSSNESGQFDHLNDEVVATQNKGKINHTH